MQFTVRRRLADRIWQWRRITYAASSALVALGFVGVFLFISSPAATVPVSTKPTFFEAPRAFRTAQDMAERYPEPELGTEQAALAADWVAERLDAMGVPYSRSEATVPFGDRDVVVRTIAAVFPGASNEAIVVTASRDSIPDSPVSALGNAGGTAILLDLAQVFAARPHERTIVLLSTEAGRYAGLGLARYLRDESVDVDARIVLSLYGLGREERSSLLGDVAGTDGAAPGWYVQLVSRTLKEGGIRLETTGLMHQVADQALRLTQGEQVAGLAAGIPSLLLYDPGPGDPSSAGLATHGAAVERLVLSLDGGSEIPADPGTALVLGSGRYLTTRALSFLGMLMLLPAAAMALTWLAVSRVRPEVWLRYLRNLVSFALPLAVWSVAVWVASRWGAVPRYEAQAVPGSPPATEPDYVVAAALLVLGFALLILSRHYLGHLRPREPLVMAETIKLSTGLSMLVLGLVVLTAHSPFSLLTGITAAWMWPLVTCFAEPRPHAASWLPRARGNAPLLLAGLAAPAILYVYLVASTDIRWWQGWWFLLVQSVSGAYGVMGPIASVLMTAGFFTLLGVKRLQLVPLETLEERDDFDLVQAAPPRVRRVKRPAPRGGTPAPPRGDRPAGSGG